jgi:Uri superfamily endonuclease
VEEPPNRPGSYALRLSLCEPACLQIGRLGEFLFPPGIYIYLGSAHGPGGLRGRLRHHARVTEQPHWHLDWLRPRARLLGGWFAVEEAHAALECAWSQAVARLPGAAIPARGFGAADCRLGCAAHLVAFPAGINLVLVEASLRLPGLVLEDLFPIIGKRT